VPCHTYECPLRWSDSDIYGHINNVEYLRLLEEARVAMFFTEPEAAGETAITGQIIVARHEIDYRKPMLYRPGTVTVRTWVDKVAAASFTLGYEIAHPEQVYANAKSVMVTFDADGQHARRLQPDEREWLARYAR